MKKKYKRIIMAVTGILTCLYFALNIYSRSYYKADETAVNIYNKGLYEDSVKLNTAWLVEDEKYIGSFPDNSETGFVFYPGGKVEPKAYLPLAKKLSDKGVTVLIAKMPYNLAVLDMNAAEELMKSYDGIDRWYIGGHSLGGAMAASYLESEGTEKYEGLILLGAYSTADLTDNSNVDKVLSITATNDKIMNREKYEENFANLPQDTTELSITGGCHSYFGSYGMQEGDGTPNITWEEQMETVSEAIADFIFENYT